jgi:hypothetical protein
MIYFSQPAGVYRPPYPLGPRSVSSSPVSFSHRTRSELHRSRLFLALHRSRPSAGRRHRNAIPILYDESPPMGVASYVSLAWRSSAASWVLAARTWLSSTVSLVPINHTPSAFSAALLPSQISSTIIVPFNPHTIPILQRRHTSEVAEGMHPATEAILSRWRRSSGPGTRRPSGLNAGGHLGHILVKATMAHVWQLG